MQTSLTHTVPVSPPIPGRSAIYQNKVFQSFTYPQNGIVKAAFPGIDTLQKWLFKIFDEYGNNNSLGTFNPKTGLFDFITYNVKP
jgi:hypothetical protein